MKRIVPILLATALAATCLAACGESSSSGGGGGSGDGKATKEVKLAVITASTTQNAFQEMAYGAAARAR